MINSRDIDMLHPKVAAMCRKHIGLCADRGIDLLITSTYRDAESQNALYEQGRTTPGHIVTNAKAGQSFHNFHCAYDVVPIRNGKPVWGTTGEDGKLWDQVGSLGKQAGLEWAGEWSTFRELAHFQYTGGLGLADLRAGKPIV